MVVRGRGCYFIHWLLSEQIPADIGCLEEAGLPRGTPHRLCKLKSKTRDLLAVRQPSESQWPCASLKYTRRLKSAALKNTQLNSCLQQWCILFLCLHGCVYNSQWGQFKKPNMINLLAVSRLFYLFTGKNSHKSIIQDHLITGLDLYLARWKCVEHAYFKSHPLQQCFAQGYISSCINGKIVTHWVVLGVSHIHASWWFVLHLWIIQHLMISDDTLGFFERPELKIKLSRVWKLRLDCNEHIEAMTLCRISSRHSPGWHLSWHRLV